MRRTTVSIAKDIDKMLEHGVLEVVGSELRLTVAAMKVAKRLYEFGWNARRLIAAEQLEAEKTDERLRDDALERGCATCGKEVAMERFSRWITGHSGPFCSDECKSRFYRLDLHRIRKEIEE